MLCCSSQKTSVLGQADYIANHWQPKITHKFEHLNSGPTTRVSIHSITHGRLRQPSRIYDSPWDGSGLIPEFILKRCPQLFPCLPEHRLPKVSVYAIHPYQGRHLCFACYTAISKELSNL